MQPLRQIADRRLKTADCGSTIDDIRMGTDDTDRTLPTRRARAGRTWRSRASASAPGRSAAAAGRSAGATQDDDDSIAAIRHAVERGVNWIDTAAVYGLGHSEEVVGRALRELAGGDRPYVFTKCGLVWDEQDRTAPAEAHRRAASRSAREVEASLTRLGVERIDLYQMHWPAEDGTPIEDVLADAARPEDGGQGPRGRALEPQRRAARARPRRSATSTRCSRRSRRSAATSPRAGAPVVRGARDRRHRLQPDAVGAADRRVHRRARRAALPADDWRSRVAGVPAAEACSATWRSPTRCGRSPSATTPPSARSRSPGRWPGRGVTGAIVGARSPRAGRRLDRRRDAGADARRDLAEIAAAIERTGAGTGPGA